MGNDKRLGAAFAASLLFNTACVAMVGTAALRHPRPPHTHDAAELHPTLLHMADAKQAPLPEAEAGDKTGADASGSEGGSGKLGSGLASGTGRGAGKVGGRTATSQAALERDEERVAVEQTRLEERLGSGSPLSVRQKAQIARRMQALAARQLALVSAHQQGAQSTRSEQQIAANDLPARRRTNSPASHSSQANEPSPGSQLSPSHLGMTVITKPMPPGKNGHIGDRGDSISPKMVKYPTAKLDLGTVHMTRPTHGVTGGGSSDLRNVDIKVHYVVDDPNNVPKTLLPDKIIKRFPSNCNGDPGNTSKCLPTGGNTRLGGTTLHGRHDQITGVKYCVPGGGGIPVAAGRSQRGRGGKQSSSVRVISERYQGRGPVSSLISGAKNAGLTNPDEPQAKVINALHLPATHSNFHGLIPGAKVPEADRKWVDDPMAHTEAAPLGKLTPPLPRFAVAPRSVGSLSRFGTLNWGLPTKTRLKKAPPGGDGTGLLGMYYHGNNFNRLVFTRPDRNIDFFWTNQTPDPRITPGTEYSVRWIGELVPQATDTYTLMLASDDGERLYLDGKLIISNWTAHSPSEDTATVHLEAGRHYSMKLEYFENGVLDAVMKLYWEAPSVPREYIPESCLRYPKAGASQ